MNPALQINNLHKGFTLHAQGGVSFEVLQAVNLSVGAGECVALHGPSGSGKSTLLRALYANYKVEQGQILIRHENRKVDMVQADVQAVLAIRKITLGYVSQFLRVIPRVPTLEVVMQPLLEFGADLNACKLKAKQLLQRLHIPKHLWCLSPLTFSGGEQQRVNIARGFMVDYPVFLLDEPTASLDAVNRDIVIELINEAKQRGAAIVGIFHDTHVREAVADRLFTFNIKKDAELS